MRATRHMASAATPKCCAHCDRTAQARCCVLDASPLRSGREEGAATPSNACASISAASATSSGKQLKSVGSASAELR
eukprot:1442189-Alexandrium_andersonii.AAC.1